MSFPTDQASFLLSLGDHEDDNTIDLVLENLTEDDKSAIARSLALFFDETSELEAEAMTGTLWSKLFENLKGGLPPNYLVRSQGASLPFIFL